jgi:hypothetical protein
MVIGDRCWTTIIVLVNPTQNRFVLPTGGFRPEVGIALLAPDSIQRHIPLPTSGMFGFPCQSEYVVGCLIPFRKIWAYHRLPLPFPSGCFGNPVYHMTPEIPVLILNRV